MSGDRGDERIRQDRREGADRGGEEEWTGQETRRNARREEGRGQTGQDEIPGKERTREEMRQEAVICSKLRQAVLHVHQHRKPEKQSSSKPPGNKCTNCGNC